MFHLIHANRIKVKENAFMASLFLILKINNYNKKH